MNDRLLLPAMFVIISFGCAVAAGARTGTWGDQGDGTYSNPILNADYPDVDIERVGDYFYMIALSTSTGSAINTMGRKGRDYRFFRRNDISKGIKDEIFTYFIVLYVSVGY